MRLYCWNCGKPVTSIIPDDTVFRGIATCPECIATSKNKPTSKKEIDNDSNQPKRGNNPRHHRP